MEASSIAIAQRRLVGTRVRGGRLHEPLAGPPRLPRRPRDVLRDQGLALRRALPARRQRRRRLRRAPRRRAALRRRRRRRPTCAARRSSCAPTAPSCSCARRTGRSRSSRACAGASTSTTCSARSRSRCSSTCRSARSSAPSRSTGAPPGRFEPVEAGQDFGVIVDYAHTPGGIAAVLASARPLSSGRLLCVFGAGGDRDHAKRPLMGAAAEAGRRPALRDERQLALRADRGRSSTQIVGGLARPRDARVEHDRRRAIGLALADAEPGDLVLILGKGHEQGQDIDGVGRAVRRPHGRAGVPRGRRVIPLAAGALDGHAPAERRSGALASRASSPTRAPPGRARCSARSRASAPTGTTSSTPCAAAGAVAVLCRSGRSRPLAGRVRARGRRPAHGARRDRASGAACVGREGDRHRRIEWQDVHEGHARRALRSARADTRHPSQPQQSPRPAVDAVPARAAARALHLRAGHERGRGARRPRRHRRARDRRDHEHRARAPRVPRRPRGRRARGGGAARRRCPPAATPCCRRDEPLLEPYRRDDVRTTTFGEPDGDVRCLAWEPGEDGHARRCSTCSACAAS